MTPEEEKSRLAKIRARGQVPLYTNRRERANEPNAMLLSDVLRRRSASRETPAEPAVANRPATTNKLVSRNRPAKSDKYVPLPLAEAEKRGRLFGLTGEQYNTIQGGAHARERRAEEEDARKAKYESEADTIADIRQRRLEEQKARETSNLEAMKHGWEMTREEQKNITGTVEFDPLTGDATKVPVVQRYGEEPEYLNPPASEATRVSGAPVPIAREPVNANEANIEDVLKMPLEKRNAYLDFLETENPDLFRLLYEKYNTLMSSRKEKSSIPTSSGIGMREGTYTNY